MWSVSLEVPAAAVERFRAVLSDVAVAVSSFEVPDDTDPLAPAKFWQIDFLLSESLPETVLNAAFNDAAMACGIPEPPYTRTEIADQDWLAATASAFPPLAIGRFWVHGRHDAGSTPPGRLPLQVDAATAFGTGEHATTYGCLFALERLAKRHDLRERMARTGPVGVLDVGTGTGILSFAAARLWPVQALATDIDAEAVRVATRAAHTNGLHHRVRFATADGTAHRAIRRHAPYALITANILARPLVRLAPHLTRLLAPGGRLILSGLLTSQVPMVANAYRAQGLVRERVTARDAWATVTLRRGTDAASDGH
jgi:ribosomal protein L11 methyltransferase